MQPQIRLSRKRSKKRLTPISSAPQPVCSACQIQFSRYTCPTCNFHYCSLTCFRSPLHSTCSESFDRKTLIDSIHSAPDKTNDEKRSMLEMLKRFERENEEREELEGEEEEADREGYEAIELADKLQGIDLDTLSPDELFQYLSPAQRAQFESILSDPSKVQALVSTDPTVSSLPWWEESSEVASGENDDDGDDESITGGLAPPLPDFTSLPSIKVNVEGKPMAHPDLIYNIIAVLGAYSFTLRSLSIRNLSNNASDHTEAHKIVSALVPFIFSKSNDVFNSVREAIDNVLSRGSIKQIGMSTYSVSLMCYDIAILMKPSTITIVNSGESPGLPERAISLRAFSDLLSLIDSISSKSTRTLAQTRCKFYCSFLKDGRIVSDEALLKIVERLTSYGEKLAAEGEDAVEESEGRDRLDIGMGFDQMRRSKIEELN